MARRQGEHQQRHELREADQPEVERIPVDLEHLPPDRDRDHVLGEAHREDRRPEEPVVAFLERRRESLQHRANLAAVAVRLSAVDETTAEKLARMQALRDEALHQGSPKAVASRRESGRLLARERVRKLLDPGSFVEIDRYVRHREVEFGMRRAATVGRRGRDRLRHRLRPQGVRLLAGLHHLRRVPERGLRREDLQGDGPGREAGLPGDRDQRLRRRADPGGRRLAGRVRGDLLAERPGVRAWCRRSRW